MAINRVKEPYTVTAIDETDMVATSAYYDIDLGTLPVRASVQSVITASSGVKTFIDGVLASGTITITDYQAAHLTAASGTITYGSPDVLTAASGTVTVADYTKAGALKSSGTVEVVDYTKLAEATAVASAALTYGTPANGSTVIVTGPAGGPFTFTKVASDPEANEFSSQAELRLLLNSITGLDAAVNVGDIEFTVETAGTGPNSWTITGTSSYAALAITFSGGQNHAVLTVNGTALTEGTDWDAETNNDTTAANLEVAVEAVTGIDSSATGAVITVTAATAGLAGDDITLATSDAVNLTISGAKLTGGRDATIVTVAGHALVANVDWTAETSDNATAINLASAINTLTEVNAAAPAAAEITVVAATGGTAGNSIATLTSYAGAVAVGGPLLTGGKAASTVTVAGSTFTCVSAGPGAGEFSSIAELTTLIENLATVNATNNGTVVAVVAATKGSAGNSIAMLKTGAGLTLSGANLTGGIDAAVVTVAGHALTESIDWTSETNNDTAADNLAAAIDALTEVAAANPAAAIITVKAATIGTAGNDITTTKTGNGVTVQQAKLSGGLNSAVAATPNTITITGHGYSTGLKVTYAVVAGTTIANLVNTTEYFVIKVDANTIKLATSKANADAGTAIDIADADDSVGAGSFSLTPEAIAATFTNYGSNDGTNWVQLDTASYTAAGGTLVQYATPAFRYLRTKVAITAGEMDAQVFVHTKF